MRLFLISIIILIGLLSALIEQFNSFMTSDIAISFLIPAFLIYFTFVFVTKGIEKYKHDNTKEIRIDDYYNEISKEDLVNLIEDWTGLFQQTELKMYEIGEKANKEMPKHFVLKPGDSKKTAELHNGTIINKIPPDVYGVGKLIMKTWIYGKTDTNKLLAQYQQHNYKNTRSLDNDLPEDYNTKSIAYIAMIIVSLRKDLMNFESDPLELMKLKISDISDKDIKNRMKNKIQEIKDEIR